MDSVLLIDKEFHDTYINRVPYWTLKLSAVLFFHVIKAVIKQEDMLILIDVDFHPTNQKHVRKYIHMLFERHKTFYDHNRPIIEFRSDRDDYIKTVDIKTKRVRHKEFEPDIELDLKVLSKTVREDFAFLSKIAEKILPL